MNKLYATPELLDIFRNTRKGLLLGYKWCVQKYFTIKSIAQQGKILSPVTQVRNVTSASLFPLANGHIGGRASHQSH